MIWANLLHLGYNMWSDRKSARWGRPHLRAQSYMRFDRDVYNVITKRMAEIGMNMLVIDLGEGVKYRTHPEIAIDGSWEVDELKAEIARLRKMGLEPIPKLNFSACHDAWLGRYSRMISSDTYYEVCADIIGEVCEIFEKPRFFHLGMDEETLANQAAMAYVVLRQYELWWHDLLFYFAQVEKAGVRPWMWSDYIWDKPATFFENMPKGILQSNWYYGDVFNGDVKYVGAWDQLDQHGFDQIPTGSNWDFEDNFESVTKYCKRHIDSERLLGFMQTIWRPCLPDCLAAHNEALDLAAKAIAGYENA